MKPQSRIIKKSPRRTSFNDAEPSSGEIPLRDIQIIIPNETPTSDAPIGISPSGSFEFDVELSDYLIDIGKKIMGHKLSANRYNKYDKLLGFPATLLGAFLSSSLMSSILLNNSSPSLTIIMFCLSLSNLILTSTRDYFQFYEKCHSHSVSMGLYSELKRTSEGQLCKIGITNDERVLILNNIISQLTIIETYTLALPEDIEQNLEGQKKIICPL